MRMAAFRMRGARFGTILRKSAKALLFDFHMSSHLNFTRNGLEWASGNGVPLSSTGLLPPPLWLPIGQGRRRAE